MKITKKYLAIALLGALHCGTGLAVDVVDKAAKTQAKMSLDKAIKAKNEKDIVSFYANFMNAMPGNKYNKLRASEHMSLLMAFPGQKALIKAAKAGYEASPVPSSLPSPRDSATDKKEKEATDKKEKEATDKKEKEATDKKEKEATDKKEKEATDKKEKEAATEKAATEKAEELKAIQDAYNQLMLFSLNIAGTNNADCEAAKAPLKTLVGAYNTKHGMSPIMRDTVELDGSVIDAMVCVDDKLGGTDWAKVGDADAVKAKLESISNDQNTLDFIEGGDTAKAKEKYDDLVKGLISAKKAGKSELDLALPVGIADAIAEKHVFAHINYAGL
jgi:flagellar motor protein MotB